MSRLLCACTYPGIIAELASERVRHSSTLSLETGLNKPVYQIFGETFHKEPKSRRRKQKSPEEMWSNTALLYLKLFSIWLLLFAGK